MREIKILIFVLTICFFISLVAAMYYASELEDCKNSRAEIAAAIHEARDPIKAQITKITGLIQEQADIRKEACALMSAITRATTPGCK